LVSSIKTGYNVRQTLDFEGRSIVEMGGKSKRIKQNLKDGENVIHEAKKRAEKVTGRISTLLEEDDDNE